MTPEGEIWVRERVTAVYGSLPEILSIKSDYATERGNNYMSDIYRLTVKMKTSSSETEDIFLIYKVLPVTGIKMGNIEDSGVFPKECKIYIDVLPKMELILRKNDTLCEMFWPKVFGVSGSCDALLMEDVSVGGYRMGNRIEGLDFEHCILSLNVLAKFHALSAVLYEKRELEIENFGTYHLFKSEEATRIRCSRWLENLAIVLEQYWKGEWLEYADGLRKLKETIAPKIMDFLRRDDSKFNTLNHGDFSTNNIMFRRDSSGNPVDIKLIDFQMSLFGNPCKDVIYFFQTSLSEMCKQRKTELLVSYHKSLVYHLKAFDYKLGIPSLENIQKYYNSGQIYGFIIGLICKPFMKIPSIEEHQNAHPELDKSNIPLSIYTYDSEDFVESLKYTLRDGIELGFI